MIKQMGLALVLVLWILSLLTIMAGSFALSMRRESAIVSGVKSHAKAAAVANSGIAMAEMMILNSDPVKRWHTDGSIYQLDSTDAKIRIRLLSEAGKIDINSASQTLLQALMAHAPPVKNTSTTSTLDRVSAIMDWKDGDDLASVNGAEKQDYEKAGLNYKPANKPFQSIEELQMIMGMDEATLKWLEPLVTVYSGQAQVSVQQASKEVLQVLPNMDSAMVDTYIKTRTENAKNNIPPPPLPNSTVSVTDSVPATVLTIVSEAQLEDESTAVITAVVKKAEGSGTTPFQVLKWQQTSENDVSLFSDTMNNLVVKQYAQSEFNH